MKRTLFVAALLLAACAPNRATPWASAPSGSTVGLPPAVAAVGAAQATPTPGPAPTEDRVGFPEGYESQYQQLFVFDRPDNRQVRKIYGNDQAAAAQPGQPFPYGSILVMETWRAKQDAEGNVELDAAGRFQPEQLGGVFVMRKEPGFGTAYQVERSGEWEYVGYRPDRSFLNPPQNTNPCAACHQDAGAVRDWVFRADLFFYNQSGALPTPPAGLAAAGRVVMQSYLFLADAITVKRGTTVTWTNEDEAVHTVTAADRRFNSGRLGLGARYSYTFDQPGTTEYVCTIHPSMRGQVIVED